MSRERGFETEIDLGKQTLIIYWSILPGEPGGWSDPGTGSEIDLIRAELVEEDGTATTVNDSDIPKMAGKSLQDLEQEAVERFERKRYDDACDPD